MTRTFVLRVAALALAATLVMPASAAAGKRKKHHASVKASVKLSVKLSVKSGQSSQPKGAAYATGYGAISTQEQNDATAYLKARNDAKIDALRNLVMRVDHVRVDAATSSTYTSETDRVNAEVHGIVRGAQIVSERQIPVGRNVMIEVTVAVPLTGPNSIANVLQSDLPKPSTLGDKIALNRAIAKIAHEVKPAPSLPTPKVAQEVPVVPVPVLKVAATPTVSESRGPRVVASNEHCVTSLIVDARGLGIDRAMAPKIRKANGKVIWGDAEVDTDFLIENGLVTYAHSLREARQDGRAGNNPLVVKAIGRTNEPFSSDVIVSGEDARAILNSNARNQFLDHFCVVFIIDKNH